MRPYLLLFLLLPACTTFSSHGQPVVTTTGDLEYHSHADGSIDLIARQSPVVQATGTTLAKIVGAATLLKSAP